jgi:hypothetical protein
VPYIRREDDEKNYDEDRGRSSTKLLKDRKKVSVVGGMNVAE